MSEKNKNSILFHGSNTVVKQPEIRNQGHNKDFGFGFYCTRFEQQAKKWALTKSPKHVVTSYILEEDENLKKLTFPEMTDEWLNCRRGVKHDYDIVEGPMADDQIWDYVEDFVSGNISREAFWALARYKHPTHQITFCTQKALQSITYKDSYEL